MFFGRRRRKKSRDFDETYVGEDFGFDEETGSRRPARADEDPEPRDDTPPPPGPDYEPRRPSRRPPRARPPADISHGRTLDDDTFVGGAPPSRPEPSLPPVLGAGDDEEELPDATRFISAPVDARATVVAWLVAVSGSGRGRDYRLDPSRTRVGGSQESAIRLVGDEYASSHHAEIRFEAGRHVLHDLQSTNGTFHNDTRVQQAVLQDGDRVRFGLSEFVFKCVQL